MTGSRLNWKLGRTMTGVHFYLNLNKSALEDMFTLCNINYCKNYLKTSLQYRLNTAMTSATTVLLFLAVMK